MDISEKFVKPNPRLTANFLSKLFFWWLRPLFFLKGKDKNLEIKDLYNVLPEISSQKLGDKLERAWFEELTKSRKKNCNPSLLKASLITFGWPFCYYGIHVFIICVILRGLLPYILGLLIWHFSPSANSCSECILMNASLLIIMIVLQAMIGHHSVVGRKEVGMKISIAYSSLIYRKLLRLSIASSNQYNTGTIVNLLSNDVSKFDDVCMFLHYIWVLPIQGLVMAYIIWDNAGVASIVGIFVLTIQTIPIQGYLARVTAKVRAKVASKTDERVRLMSEIVNGIRVIKMYTWEKPFEKLVFLARKCEVDAVAIKFYLRGVSTATSAFAESTSLFFVVLLLGDVLQATVVYLVVQYLGMIKTMMTVFFPRAISSAAEARVSIRRIQILKGSMDGTTVEKLITSPGVTALALDTQTPKLYWSDSEKIESADYSGNQRITVIRTSSSTASLGVSGTRLFWIKAPNQTSTGSRTLWTCAMTGGICADSDSQQIPFDDPKMIKVYTGEGPAIGNPCEDDNGGCKQLCLISSVNGKASCACFIGYKLQDDNQSCELVTEYVIYTRGSFVRGRILDASRQAFSDAIPPIKLQQTSLDEKKALDIDYNYYTNTLAFSDDRSVGTIHLLNDDEGNYPRDRCLRSVSYDWLTDDIYYVRDNCHLAENTSIMLMKPKRNAYFWKTMRTFDRSIGHPTSLVVHPNRGIYFFVILLEGNARIYRSRGSKMSFFSDDEQQQADVNETALAIDFAAERLYWFSKNSSRLYSADLKDGTKVRSIDVSLVNEPRSVSVHERYAYVANLTDIWRFDKFTGYGGVKMVPRLDFTDPREMIGGVKIFGKTAQQVDADNPCANDNGKCEQFCLREPKYVVTGPNTVNVTDSLQRVCVCEDYKTIRSDGRTYEVKSESDEPKDTDQNHNNVIIKDLNVSWKDSSDELVLRNINLVFSAKTLYVISGPVGSGKSTLLKTILGELQPSDGEVHANGKVSYACQEPWLFPGTVRSNIVFGQDFDEEKYERVVNACALKEDFSELPDGDSTLVGDYGSTLSGGQCARINLARAIYRNADIYLIDDALAAVDSHVGRYIFDNCINGYLKDKTRILITHNIQYFKEADEIIIIKNGKVDFKGSYAGLEAQDYHIPELPLSDSIVNQPPFKERNPLQDKSELTFIENKSKKARKEANEDSVTNGKDATDSVSCWRYFRAGGSIMALLCLALSFILAQASVSGCDYWLAHWMKQQESRAKLSLDKHNVSFDSKIALYVYSALLLTSIITWMASSLLFYKICMNASKNLHNQMFSCLLKTPVRFFELNHPGVILNRFSKDIGLVDETLPTVTLDALQVLLMMSGVAIQILVINWWSIFPMVAMAVTCWKFKNIYLPTAQNIRRLESKCKSPVFTHVTSTISGLTTIRSAEVQNKIKAEFDNLQDIHTSANYLNIVSSSAFGFWLDMLSVILLAFVTFSFTFVNRNEVFAAIVGFAITQILMLYGKVQYGLRQTTEMMTQLISVERIFQFINLEQEGPFETGDKKDLLMGWPNEGRIDIENLFLKYSDDERHVLKNITLHIEPQEKIGIVGRTGAGKTSLISVLYRLVDPEGSIYIDGINIKTIGLHDLRSKITIISQNPVLFTGSVRNNLDPLQKSNDQVLMQILEEVALKTQFASLDYQIENEGNNLSSGEKQLLCLARAIIANNKIVILDEATSNIDFYTDEIIQNTIKKRFFNCTVITIAHRLSTIVDSDRIIVIDQGKIEEFDSPHVLMKQKDGYFSNMVNNI